MKIDNQATIDTQITSIRHGYSYVRLSSKKQLGDEKSGAERQMERPREICDDHNWELQSETFADLGVSSFHGKNRLDGRLAEFIRLAKEGKLKSNPVLILEAWDRYSRGTIDDAFQSVREVLKAGVAFHVAYGDRTFVAGHLEDENTRNEITQALAAAHRYSQQLSDRVRKAKQRKFTKIANGGTANISEVAPSWVDWDRGSQSFVLNKRGETVSNIFRMYMEGETIVSIVKTLNDIRKVKPWYGKQWHRASIRYILGNKSVTGEFRGKKIYPQLISTDDYKKVQDMLERNRNRRGRSTNLVNIFRGLVHCTCTASVSMTKNKGRNYSYYRCPYHKEGTCTQTRMMKTDIVEESFFLMTLQTLPDTILKADDKDKKEKLAGLKARKETIHRKIKVILDMDDDFNAEELKNKYASLKTELGNIDSEIKSMESELNLISNAPAAVAELQKLFNAEGMFNATEITKQLRERLKDIKLRKRLQVTIPSIVRGVRIDFNNSRFWFDLTTGKTIGLQEYK